MLKVLGLIGPKARVAREENVVVQLLGKPLVLRERCTRVRPRLFIEFLVFFRTEPGPVHHLPL
jgi:hypothetical protein